MTDRVQDELTGDIRPVVSRQVGNRGVWAFAGLTAAIALGLFGALEAQRSAISSPAVTGATEPPGTFIASPPPLAVPEMSYRPVDPAYLPAPRVAQSSPAIGSSAQRFDNRPNRSSANPRALDYPQIAQSPPVQSQPAASYAYRAEQPNIQAAPSEADSDKADTVRLTASHFNHPATTVPQGAIIQAVLETALDSNRAGYARAVVSRDVYSFDGSRVLIARGSKLFGEYKSDLNSGQNRALIQWRRVTRPDGVIIDINSPSADPLGRAGVKGKVNSHFFERFGGAMLQSVLDIGVQLAARKATGDTIIFGLPGAVPQVTQSRPNEVKPTLTVKQGTSVSVFVVHDLDFTDVGN